MAERKQRLSSTSVGGVRRNTRRSVDSHTTFQAEIDNWIAVAKKSTSSAANRQQEQEAQSILTNSGLNKLRDLQKEICQTNWMFDNTYP